MKCICLPHVGVAAAPKGSRRLPPAKPAITTHAPWFAFFCLQQRKGTNKKAKSTTQEEFEDNMAMLHGKVLYLRGAETWKPLYCYDNNRIQANAEFRRMYFACHQRVHIPPYSPDFNKPIEHVFHQMKDKLRVKIYQHNGPLEVKQLRKWVVEIFEQEISVDSIAKDVQSLKNTYLAVSTDKGCAKTTPNGHTVMGTGGDWPEPHLA